MLKLRISCISLVACVASAAFVQADPTVGLIDHGEGPTPPGHTSFSPMAYTSSYLIDLQGRLVHQWDHDEIPGNAAYLLHDGSILRTANPGSDFHFTGGGQGGIVTSQDWDGTLEWTFEYNDDQHRLHHDIEPMPNGNVLMIAWEYKSRSEAIQAGRDPSTVGSELWPDVIIEVDPTAPGGPQIVWEWHAWDHLVQNFDETRDNYQEHLWEHPGLININFYATPQPDWLHLNAIDYHPELDQILVSCPRFKEVWIIDHSTTTEEAAGHAGGDSGMGGDLLYRWGNPRTWDAGTTTDQRLFAQHGANWIEPGLDGEGEILFFNNGVGRPGGIEYSSIESIQPPLNAAGTYDREPGVPYGPDESTVIYVHDPPGDLYAEFLSGAQRLPNGNTLICDGPHGHFYEVTPAGEIAWEYINPVVVDGPLYQCEEPTGTPTMLENNTFRVLRYGPGFPGFKGQDLLPGGPIELYTGDYTGDGLVNVSDLLHVIAGWGDPWDIEDLLLVIASWGGACP